MAGPLLAGFLLGRDAATPLLALLVAVGAGCVVLARRLERRLPHRLNLEIGDLTAAQDRIGQARRIADAGAAGASLANVLLVDAIVRRGGHMRWTRPAVLVASAVVAAGFLVPPARLGAFRRHG